MSFSSKHRRLSRRERYNRDARRFKVIVLFAFLGLIVYGFMRRDDLSFYFKTMFY